MTHTFKFSTWEAVIGAYFEFEFSLVYRMCFRTTRATLCHKTKQKEYIVMDRWGWEGWKRRTNSREGEEIEEVSCEQEIRQEIICILKIFNVTCKESLIYPVSL